MHERSFSPFRTVIRCKNIERGSIAVRRKCVSGGLTPISAYEQCGAKPVTFPAKDEVRKNFVRLFEVNFRSTFSETRIDRFFYSRSGKYDLHRSGKKAREYGI